MKFPFSYNLLLFSLESLVLEIFAPKWFISIFQPIYHLFGPPCTHLRRKTNRSKIYTHETMIRDRVEIRNTLLTRQYILRYYLPRYSYNCTSYLGPLFEYIRIRNPLPCTHVNDWWWPSATELTRFANARFDENIN